MDKVACGNLEIKVAKKSKKIKIEPVVRYQPMGTIIHLDKGTQFLSFQEPGNPVKESLVLEEPVKEVKPQGIPTKFESPVVAYIKQPNNSFLLIQDLERMPDHQLSVFNRWGKEIFHTLQYQNDWSGTSQNLTIPEGIYYYVLNNGKGETYTGSFNFRP